MSQRQSSPIPGNADPAAAAFLRRVDANHDGQVSQREMIAFLSANVDLNHNGKVSLYEQASYQLRDPQGGRLLFPGS